MDIPEQSIYVSPASLGTFVDMDDDTTISKQVKRPLPAANQKAAGFAAFRVQAKRPKKSGASGSASGAAAAQLPTNVRPRPRPKHIGQSVTNKSASEALTHDPDDQPNPSHTHVSPVSESRGGKKRKLNEIEIIELEDVEETIGVLNSEELGDTGPLNQGSIEVLNSEGFKDTKALSKACTLVRAALAKAVEGEKERLRLEACLRQQITSLESKLEQESKAHDDSKRHIRDLERGLLAASSSIELTNRVIQTTTAQLIETRSDVGREKETRS